MSEFALRVGELLVSVRLKGEGKIGVTSEFSTLPQLITA